MSKVSTIWSVLLLSALTAFGQGTTSRVVGTVTDPTGSVVPAAQVRLTNEDSGITFNTTTTETGTYVFEAIQVGKYRMTFIQ